MLKKRLPTISAAVVWAIFRQERNLNKENIINKIYSMVEILSNVPIIILSNFDSDERNTLKRCSFSPIFQQKEV